MTETDDLAELYQEFPAWTFGSVWATAASGPDRRRIWARQGDVLLVAWSAPELRRAIEAAGNQGPHVPYRP